MEMEWVFALAIGLVLTATIVGVFICIYFYFFVRRPQRAILRRTACALRQESREKMLEWLVKAGVLSGEIIENSLEFPGGTRYTGKHNLVSLVPLLGRHRPLLGAEDIATILSSLVYSEKVNLENIATAVLRHYPSHRWLKVTMAMDKVRPDTGLELKTKIIAILNDRAATRAKGARASTLEAGLRIAKSIAKHPRN